MKKGIIIDVISNIASKKSGNRGSLVIVEYTNDANETTTCAIWNNDPSYEPAFKECTIVQDATTGFFRMQGNFITKSDRIKLTAQYNAEYSV